MENNHSMEPIYFKGEGIIDEVDYARIEQFNKEKTEKLAKLYEEILALTEPDSGREGLKKTPLRVSSRPA